MPPQRSFVEGHVLSNSAGRVLPPTLGVEQIMPRGVLWGKAAPKQKARDKLFAPEGADMDTGMSRGTVGGVLRQKAAGRYSDSGGDGLQSGKLTGAPDWCNGSSDSSRAMASSYVMPGLTEGPAPSTARSPCRP